MTMNVYLALAMTSSAALEGIKNKIDPGKPTDRDLYQMTEDEFKMQFSDIFDQINAYAAGVPTHMINPEAYQ